MFVVCYRGLRFEGERRGGEREGRQKLMGHTSAILVPSEHVLHHVKEGGVS